MARISRLILLLFCAATCSILVAEIAREVNLIGDLTESSLRLASWLVMVAFLLFLYPSNSSSRGETIAVSLFCLSSTMGWVLGVCEDVASLSDTPLIGDHGYLNQPFKKLPR